MNIRLPHIAQSTTVACAAGMIPVYHYTYVPLPDIDRFVEQKKKKKNRNSRNNSNAARVPANS